MNRDDFDNYDNLTEYWMREDALRSLDYDVYFSLGTRYYCDRGYIKSLGGQALNRKTSEEIKEFFEWVGIKENFEINQ